MAISLVIDKKSRMRKFYVTIVIALLFMACKNKSQSNLITKQDNWITINQKTYTAAYPPDWERLAGQQEFVVSDDGFQIAHSNDTTVRLWLRISKEASLKQAVKNRREDIIKMQKGEGLTEEDVDYGPAKGHSFTYCFTMDKDTIEQYEVNLWVIGDDLYEGTYMYQNKLFYEHVNTHLFQKHLSEAHAIFNTIKVKAPLELH